MEPATNQTTEPATLAWWQCGLLGAALLSLVTVVKLLATLLRPSAGAMPWGELPGFAVKVFAMGFLAGAVVRVVLPLFRRGLFGEALGAAIVLNCFFLGGMTAFAPDVLSGKRPGGGLMLALATVVGLFMGPYCGYKWRQAAAERALNPPPPPPDENQPTA